MNSFTTTDLPFAAFLYSTRKLRFLGCEEMNGDGRIAFRFDDPQDEGLERRHARTRPSTTLGPECAGPRTEDDGTRR